jgi:hypothetical protein
MPEDTLPEQAHGDEQHSGADERDEQLGVDLGRQMADRVHEPIVAATQRPPVVGDGDPPRLRRLLPWSAQGRRAAEPTTMSVISHLPPIRATS